MDTSNFDRAAAIGQVILRAREVETILHRASGSDVAGIHALTEILSSRLPETLQQRLHWIATIRNQAAHEAEFQLSEADFAQFQGKVQETIEELERLFPAAYAGTDAPEAKPFDVAVEQELFVRVRKNLTILGFIPVFGVINLFFLVLQALTAQIGILLLILFYASAIPMVVESYRNDFADDYWKFGAATAVGVYLCTLLVYWKDKDRPRIPSLFVWFPGLHVVYLLARWGKRLAWGKVLLALGGFASLAGMVHFVLLKDWRTAFWFLVAEWVFSIAGSIFYRVREVEE